MRQVSGLGPYQTEYYGVNGPKRGVDDLGRQVMWPLTLNFVQAVTKR